MQIKYNPQTLGQLPGQPAGGESMDEALFLFKEKGKVSLLLIIKKYRSLMSFPSDSPP